MEEVKSYSSNILKLLDFIKIKKLLDYLYLVNLTVEVIDYHYS